MGLLIGFFVETLVNLEEVQLSGLLWKAAQPALRFQQQEF